MTGDFLMVMLKAKDVRDRDYPSCPWVVNIQGKPVRNFDHGWKALVKRLGLEGLLFHDLRRTGVRNLVRAGVPETVAMKISGHKTRSVFDRYNVTSEEDLRAAATKLEGYIQKQKVTNTVTTQLIPNMSQQEEVSKVTEHVGGEGGIRTHGPFQDNGFRDRPNRPLSHLSAPILI